MSAMALPRDRHILREYYSHTNAPELNCPFYSQFRLYKRREICRLVLDAMDAIRARGSRTVKILDLGSGDGADMDAALCKLTDYWKRPERADGVEVAFAEGDPCLVDILGARIDDLTEVLPALRARARQVDLAGALPYADGEFHIVLCSEVVEHLENPEAALAEIHRVLVPSGLLVFTTDNEPTLFGRLKRTAAKLVGRYSPGERERFLSSGEKTTHFTVQIGGAPVPVYGHINTRTSVEWESALRRAGFTVSKHGGHDSVVRHFGAYSPWKMALVSLANAAAASLPDSLGRHLCATTLLLLSRSG